MLHARGAGCVRNGQRLLAPLDLQFVPGQLHAVLGPNGAGKSTLLKLLAAELPCSEGSVELHGRGLQQWPIAQLSRVRAVLPQMHALSFPFTAREVVALGRTQALRHADDAQIISAALAACGADHLADRLYPRLSGGERARVQLARSLAQIWETDASGPRYLLLDEPTAHLDLAYQHACLRLARQWAAQGVGVIAVLHDPNLVLAYADTVSLLCDGRLIAQGSPRAVITSESVQQVYGLRAQLLDRPDGQAWLAVTRQ